MSLFGNLPEPPEDFMNVITGKNPEGDFFTKLVLPPGEDEMNESGSA